MKKAVRQTVLADLLKVPKEQKQQILVGVEVWVPIPNLEEYYLVSSYGRIMRLQRTVQVNNGTTIYNRTYPPLVLTPSSTSNGYLDVSIKFEGKRDTRNIHTIMVHAFYGIVTDGTDLVTDHVDSNKHNNNIRNLDVVTQRYNTQKYCKRNNDNHSSKYMGVYWHRGINKWCTGINVKGRKIHLLSSDNEQACRDAYLEAVEKYKPTKPIK